MTKRIVAKTGTYMNQQNEIKNKYVDVGVILSNENGEYLLLNPNVSLAGILIQQNHNGAKEGKAPRDTVMCSVFDNSNNQQQVNQPAQQHRRPAPPPNNQPMGSHTYGQQMPPDNFYDDPVPR